MRTRRASRLVLPPARRELGAVAEVDAELDADDRLDPGLGELLREFEGAEEVVRIGYGERRHGVGAGERCQLADRHGALAQGVGRVDVQMDEAGLRRGARRRWLARRARRPGPIVLARHASSLCRPEV